MPSLAGSGGAPPHTATGTVGAERVVRTPADEVARLLRRPQVDLLTVGANAAAVTVLWLMVPQEWRDWFFDNVQGRLAFAVVLGTWMLSDTTSTNLLGNDPATAVAALRGQTSLVRALVVKIVVFGLLVGTLSVAVAVFLSRHSLGRSWVILPSLEFVPVGVVAIASLLGVVLPFRLRSLRWRWRRSGDLRDTVRWACLVALPYFGIGPLVAGYVMAARWLAGWLTDYPGGGRPPVATVAVTSVVSVVVAGLCVVVCPLLARWWVESHREGLLRQLGEPDGAE